jgi:hypothetical protein
VILHHDWREWNEFPENKIIYRKFYTLSEVGYTTNGSLNSCILIPKKEQDKYFLNSSINKKALLKWLLDNYVELLKYYLSNEITVLRQRKPKGEVTETINKVKLKIEDIRDIGKIFKDVLNELKNLQEIINDAVENNILIKEKINKTSNLWAMIYG